MVHNKEGLVIGYINPKEIYPYPLTTIYQDGEKYIIRWSNLDCMEFKKINLEKLINSEKFIPEENNAQIFEDQYSYGISKDNIIIGNDKSIARRLKREINSGKLDEYLNNEITNYISLISK